MIILGGACWSDLIGRAILPDLPLAVGDDRYYEGVITIIGQP